MIVALKQLTLISCSSSAISAWVSGIPLFIVKDMDQAQTSSVTESKCIIFDRSETKHMFIILSTSDDPDLVPALTA